MSKEPGKIRWDSVVACMVMLAYPAGYQLFLKSDTAQRITLGMLMPIPGLLQDLRDLAVMGCVGVFFIRAVFGLWGIKFGPYVIEFYVLAVYHFALIASMIFILKNVAQ